MGIVSNPTFVTSGGIELHLKPIPPILFDRFDVEYKKLHPKPVPPKREAMIGEEKVVIYDPKDAWYQEQLSDWESNYFKAILGFMATRGVVNNPPDDWSPDPELYSEALSPSQAKGAWILEQLLNDADLQGLPEAIRSLTQPTTQALDEAKKN